MKKNIKKFTNLVLSAALVMSIFTGCSSNTAAPAETTEESESKELTKVVVSEFRGMNYAAVHIADAMGYFEEQGLDVFAKKNQKRLSVIQIGL